MIGDIVTVEFRTDPAEIELTCSKNKVQHCVNSLDRGAKGD